MKLTKEELDLLLAKWSSDCDLCANKDRNNHKVSCDIRKALVLRRDPMAINNIEKFLTPYGFCKAFSPKGVAWIAE